MLLAGLLIVKSRTVTGFAGVQHISNDNDATNDLQKVVHPSAIGTNMDVDLIWTKPLIGFSVGTQIRHILSSLSLGHIHLHYIKGQ